MARHGRDMSPIPLFSEAEERWLACFSAVLLAAAMADAMAMEFCVDVFPSLFPSTNPAHIQQRRNQGIDTDTGRGFQGLISTVTQLHTDTSRHRYYGGVYHLPGAIWRGY